MISIDKVFSSQSMEEKIKQIIDAKHQELLEKQQKENFDFDKFRKMGTRERAKFSATQAVWTPRNRLEKQEKQVKAELEAFKSAKSAIATYRDALHSMNTLYNQNGGLSQQTATASVGNVASFTPHSTAKPGTHHLFVEQVATRSKLMFNGLTDTEIDSADGTLKLTIDGKTTDIPLAGVKTLNDLVNNIQSKSTAIGARLQPAPNGGMMLVLESADTGKKNAITVNYTPGASGATPDLFSRHQKTLSSAEDAKVWLTGEGPFDPTQPNPNAIAYQQSSNTFVSSVIPGVTIALQHAQTKGDPNLSVTVGNDNQATQAQMKKFVDAYNALKKVLEPLTQSQNNEEKRGILADDSNISNLFNTLNNQLFGSKNGKNVTQFGIGLEKNGRLKLDSSKLQQALASDPQGLATLFDGHGALNHTLEKSVEYFLSRQNISLKQREEALHSKQKSITRAREDIETRYKALYQSYLKKYMELEKLLNQLASTQNMFDND